MAEKNEIDINERPRFCCFNLNAESLKILKTSGFNIHEASLGKKISVPNHHRGTQTLLLGNSHIPENLHEFDIIIIDLNNFETIDYDKEDHTRETHTGKSAYSFLTQYPETLFDPRPFYCNRLYDRLASMGKREHLVIVFATSNFAVEYEMVKANHSGAKVVGPDTHGIYSFINIPLESVKHGNFEVSFCEQAGFIKEFLEPFIDKISYDQTFYHPTTYNGTRRVKDSSFFPLLKNSSGEIISFAQIEKYSNTFCFPEFKNQVVFLKKFLLESAPGIFPNLFPYSTTNSWRDQQEYWLPGHSTLLDQKKAIHAEYNEKINKNEDEISKNLENYSFLHRILTETDTELVNALIEYFQWLGFESITDMDKAKSDSDLLEEDIQIEIDEGLLIIECKGIGGTSTDSDCSQISKVKHRRCKERNEFDVFALYIVNHQRHLPPLMRENPPFDATKIKDAKNDERGLLNTWQLYNLYFDIEKEVISKEEARRAILEFGLVEFKPDGLTYLDQPKEILKEGLVCIVNIKNSKVTVGDELYIEKNNRFTKVQVVGVQKDDEPVESISDGEVGLKFNKKIKKKSKIWTRKL